MAYKGATVNCVFDSELRKLNIIYFLYIALVTRKSGDKFHHYNMQCLVDLNNRFPSLPTWYSTQGEAKKINKPNQQNQPLTKTIVDGYNLIESIRSSVKSSFLTSGVSGQYKCKCSEVHCTGQLVKEYADIFLLSLFF